MAESKDKNINGISVEELFSTIDAIKENPEIAKFKFRVANQWIGGTHNRATVHGFYGALKEDDSREPILLDMGEPPALLGKNEGPNPVEVLLAALSGCVTTSLMVQASARGIALRGVESRYEGDLDLRGLLDLSEDVPVGFQDIRVYFKIDADLSDEEKEELIDLAKKYSPVFNTITKSTPVSVHLDKETARPKMKAAKESAAPLAQ